LEQLAPARDLGLDVFRGGRAGGLRRCSALRTDYVVSRSLTAVTET